jgi:cytochrome c-type biogenesis protein CcmE
MTDAMKKRVFAVVALLIAGGALAWISMSDMEDSMVYYWSPTELLASPNAKDATVRLGGMVVPGTYSWDQEGHKTQFDVSDGSKEIHVIVAGNPPQMFREGIGVVVEGKLGHDGVFQSDKVMVKHSNEYEAPEDGAPPSDMYKTLANGEDG